MTNSCQVKHRSQQYKWHGTNLLSIEGISFEEQGERYATGERAQRNYEKAATMYSKAFALNEKDADCVYNWQV